MPRDLHPSLTDGPEPKPICAGCQATDASAVLAPVNGSKTLFFCLTCAGTTYLSAYTEMSRRATMALIEAIAPLVAA